MKAKMVSNKRRNSPLCKSLEEKASRTHVKNASRVMVKDRNTNGKLIKKAPKQSQSTRPATSKAKEIQVFNRHGYLVSKARHLAGKKAQKAWLEGKKRCAAVAERTRHAKLVSHIDVEYAEVESLLWKKQVEHIKNKLDFAEHKEEDAKSAAQTSSKYANETKENAFLAARDLRMKQSDLNAGEHDLAIMEAEALEDARAAFSRADDIAKAAETAKNAADRNLENVQKDKALVKDELDQAQRNYVAAFKHAITLRNTTHGVLSIEPKTPRRTRSGGNQRQAQTPPKSKKPWLQRDPAVARCLEPKSLQSIQV